MGRERKREMETDREIDGTWRARETTTQAVDDINRLNT